LKILKNDLKSILRGKISDELIDFIPSSFDIIGSKTRAIAIIDIPDELKDSKVLISKALMQVHKNVKSVLDRNSERTGEFRLRDYQLILGDPNTEVIHKESGCLFKLDPRVTYFSTRESTERERICAQITEPEIVLVMFSGVGPFPICIAKHNEGTECIAIEINPKAHAYCVENIQLNKLEGRISAFQGDVKDIGPSLGMQFDRVLAPLPKGAHLFLNIIIPLVKPDGILHFYHWAPDFDLFSDASRLVRNAASKHNRRCEVIRGVRVSKYSPRVSKIRIDVRIF
jgi:tRNA (guanine37-N1)-methyltransferase